MAAFLIALSNVGAAAAYLAAVARLPFVAGIDHFLPPAFGSAASALENTVGLACSHNILSGCCSSFSDRPAPTSKGAYDVLASMTVIVYFIPYLYVFAAIIKLQREPAGPDVIRVPGGRPVAIFISVIGLLTTTATILLSVMPPPDDPNKPLAVLKIVGGTVALLAAGGWIYWAGKRQVSRSA